MIFSLKNFNKMRNNIYNLGLSQQIFYQVATGKRNKEKCERFTMILELVDNKKDPDQRDYFVSNKKIEKKGFKT